MYIHLYKNSVRFLLLMVTIFSWLFYSFQTEEQKDKEIFSSFVTDTIKANQLIIDSEVLFDEDEYELAIEKLEAAKLIYRRYELWEELVECMVEESVIADNLAVETKKKYAYQSLNIAKKYLVKDDYQFGKAYQQVGEVEMMNENYDSSIVYFNRALRIFEKRESWSSYAWAIISKSVNYYYKDDFESFKNELLVAQEYFEKYDLDKEIYITTIDLLAFVYEEQGDFDRAIENTKNSIHYYLDLPKKSRADSNSIATSYLNVGLFYSDIGAYQKARFFALKVIEFSKKINSVNHLNALTQMSHDALDIGNYEKSINYCYRSLKIIPKVEKNKQESFYTLTYSYLGKAFMCLNMLDSSEYYLELAMNSSDGRYRDFAMVDYAELLLEQNKPNEALELLNRTIKSDITDSSVKGLFFRNMGRAYSKKGDFEKGVLFFQKSLNYRIPTFTDTLNPYANPTIFGKVKDPMFILNDLKYKANHLSQFSEKQQNLVAALATYDLAFQWIDTLLQTYAFDDSRIIHNQRNREIYEQAVDVAQQLHEQTGDEKYIHKAFSYAEKIKSNVLLADLQGDKSRTIIPERIQERISDLAANIVFYERQLEMAKKDTVVAKIKLYQNYLTNYQIDLSELKDSIKDKYGKYYELKYSTTLATIPTIQADLNKDEAFISYYSGDSSTYVFSISDTHIKFKKLGETTTIDGQVINLRNLLKLPGNKEITRDFKRYNEVSNQLYETILAKNIQDLPNRINKLIIIPDGTLNYIPFEILTHQVETKPSQDFSKMPYLLYDYQIQYGYSATLLRENKERQNQLNGNSECLAYAPVYKQDVTIARRGTTDDLRDGTTLLQSTSKEIDGIANHFNGEFNQSETATKANFIKSAPDFGILHLAMHGEANYENEKFANLKFTNIKNQSKEDYLLYQSEIANLDLNAQLVVLSACETGVGKYLYGEGIASLGRSFMYAGVPSIVMSLWKVDDRATSQLMPYFYEKLATGMSKDEALHQAKLTFLKKEDFSKLHPHYWASFVSIGDIQPIKNSTNWTYLVFGIGFIILALTVFLFRKIKKIRKYG